MKNKIDVVSKNNGSVSLTDPITRIGRTWQKAGDVISLTEDEIMSMSTMPGAMFIFKNYLIIKDEKFAAELFREEIQPEYFYDKETICKLLKEGSDEQLEDALNFGGEGVVELIKDCALELRIESYNKRELIHKASGCDVNFIINNLNDIDKEEKASQNGEKPTETEVKNDSAPKRRAATPFVATNASKSEK